MGESNGRSEQFVKMCAFVYDQPLQCQLLSDRRNREDVTPIVRIFESLIQSNFLELVTLLCGGFTNVLINLFFLSQFFCPTYFTAAV